MAGVLVRRALVALAAVCACAVAAAPAFAAPPPNDTWQTASELVPANQIGNRNIPSATAVDGSGSQLVREVDVTDATTAPDDPLLRTEVEDSTCNGAPTEGNRTVFYRLRMVERTQLMIDTLSSTYPTALALYAESVSGPTLVACAAGNLFGLASALDYVARAGTTYYLEVAGTTNQAGPTRLSLFMRATDVQPPRLSLVANQALAEPGKTTTFELPTPAEEGSGFDDPRPAPVWRVTFTPDTGEPIEVPATLVGSEGNEIRVKWPGGSKVAGRGTAEVTLADRAGNVGTNSLTLRVRDRSAPAVKKPGFRVDHRRNSVWAWVRCTEAGKARINLLGPSGGEVSVNVRRDARKAVRWSRRRSGGYLLTYRCQDRAGNWSATRLTRPFLLR